MKKPFWIGGIILLVIVLSVSFYYFTNMSGERDLLEDKANLEARLVDSKARLSQEEQKLNALRAELASSLPLASGAQRQMNNVIGVVAKTDFMFNGANSSNPQLKVASPVPAIEINAQRAQVNSLIASWREKTKLSYLESIDVDEAAQIKQDTETIQAFISDLVETVQALTPLNSGLTQAEIDAYIAGLPTGQELGEVLQILESLIQSQVDSTTTPPSEVSPEIVVAQEQVVEEIVQEIVTIETELEEIQEVIETQQPVTPEPVSNETQDEQSESAPVVEPENSEPESEVYENENVPESGGNTELGVTGPSEGASDPGQPQLIQGANPY